MCNTYVGWGQYPLSCRSDGGILGHYSRHDSPIFTQSYREVTNYVVPVWSFHIALVWCQYFCLRAMKVSVSHELHSWLFVVFFKRSDHCNAQATHCFCNSLIISLYILWLHQFHKFSFAVQINGAEKNYMYLNGQKALCVTAIASLESSILIDWTHEQEFRRVL